MKRILIASVLLAALALLATACGGAPAAAPTAAPAAPTAAPAAPTAAPAQPTAAPAQPTAAPAQPTAAPAQPTAAPAQPTAMVQLPADAVTQKGRLNVCTDFPYPPQEFFDENGNPTGLDIDLGNEIGARLGLKTQYINSVFDTIIAAVKSGKCDIVISAQNITTDRKKQVSMIPYFQAGQSMVVAKGNPQGIKEPLDLCGKSAAAESGTTEADYLQGTGDHEGKGLIQQCEQAGKPKVDVILTQKDTDALAQLQSGKVAVYFADSPVAAYYTVQHPDQFEVTGQIVEPALEGISVPCGQEDCTSAPLTPLGQAVKAALKSMMDDGTYQKILAKWKLENSAVTPDQLGS